MFEFISSDFSDTAIKRLGQALINLSSLQDFRLNFPSFIMADEGIESLSQALEKFVSIQNLHLNLA